MVWILGKSSFVLLIYQFDHSRHCLVFD